MSLLKKGLSITTQNFFSVVGSDRASSVCLRFQDWSYLSSFGVERGKGGKIIKWLLQKLLLT